MLRIKNILALLIFIFVLIATTSASAQDWCKFSEYKSLPVAVSAIVPAYPAKAVATKAEGNVQIEVEIDKTGKIIQATFVSGHELLKKPAMDAAIKWKFNEVAENAGVRKTRLTFTFYLNDDNEKEPNLDEIRYKHHLKVYRDFFGGDCFNNCGKTKEQ